MNAERLEAQGVRLAFATSSPTGEADAPGGSRSYDGKDESESSEPAAPPAEPAPEPESEPVVAAEEDAASSDDKLDVGAARAPSPSKRKASERRTRGEQTRCERICDLAEATCTLSDRICELAAEHVDDVRYENACERATSQCEAASEACSMCEE